jgi:hypothetical protein
MNRKQREEAKRVGELFDEPGEAIGVLRHFLNNSDAGRKVANRQELLTGLKALELYLVGEVLRMCPSSFVQLPNGKWMSRKNYKAPVVQLIQAAAWPMIAPDADASLSRCSTLQTATAMPKTRSL